MNPYQDVIDWLRSPEGERWSETRMHDAACTGAADSFLLAPSGWHLNRRDGSTTDSPLYLGGVLSVKEDEADE